MPHHTPTTLRMAFADRVEVEIGTVIDHFTAMENGERFKCLRNRPNNECPTTDFRPIARNVRERMNGTR